MVVWMTAGCYAKQCHGSARLDWKENSGEQNAIIVCLTCLPVGSHAVDVNIYTTQTSH